jgi:hypothetical protein
LESNNVSVFHCAAISKDPYIGRRKGNTMHAIPPKLERDYQDAGVVDVKVRLMESAGDQ